MIYRKRYATFLRICFIGLVAIVASLVSYQSSAQTDIPSPRELKKLSVEELMNLEVTLVSRAPLRLAQAASAIQVITADDIRHSGATNLPEVLRLVTNLQVAQLNANAWIISARGFNTTFANKLLVMIDGRTVYTPLFGGVIWEMQHVLLEDVERIEVISGPGGTLWGANAVNGVINIITRSTSQTQGLYATAMVGTFVKDHAAVRYGGKISDKISYKIYAQHSDRNNTFLENGKDNMDQWRNSQAGFKMDWNSNEKNAFTVQGDYYTGAIYQQAGNSDFDGQNVLARWSHTFSPKSHLVLQVYYDRYFRDDMTTKGSDEMNTADLDLQYGFSVGKLHSVLVGAGYRYARDHTTWDNIAGILPPKKNLDLLNVFIQDEISVTKNLKATIGTKVMHNVYTGVEYQPSVRAAYNLSSGQTLWAAASRAVRVPSRFDADYYLPQTPQPPTVPSVAGGPNFVAEKLFAYELGYRIQPNAVSNFSLSTFYHVYNDLYSVEALPNTLTYQVQNGSQGTSWGAEFAGTYQVHKNWRLRGGYTFFDKVLEAKPGRVFDPAYLSNDARHQAMLQCMLELPFNLQLDLVGRYIDELPKSAATAAVPSYITFDARLAYQSKRIEISVVGQSINHKRHAEFGTNQLPRGIYGRITVRI